MLRSIAVAAAVAALGLTLFTAEADARQGGGGSRGGFSGGGFRGGAPAFRGGGGPSFRGGFAGPGAFRNINPGFRAAGPGFRRYGNFRRYGPGFGIPLAIGALGAYGYYNNSYNDCVVPQNVLTPYGWQTRFVNVCDDY